MTDQPGSVARGFVRAHLLRVAIHRPKRIDDYIDYFGDGGARPTGRTARRTDDRATDGFPLGPAPWGEGD